MICRDCLTRLREMRLHIVDGIDCGALRLIVLIRFRRWVPPFLPRTQRRIHRILGRGMPHGRGLFRPQRRVPSASVECSPIPPISQYVPPKTTVVVAWLP